MTSSNKFTFDTFEVAENLKFYVFFTHNKQWWIAEWSTIWHAKLRRKYDWSTRWKHRSFPQMKTSR